MNANKTLFRHYYRVLQWPLLYFLFINLFNLFKINQALQKDHLLCLIGRSTLHLFGSQSFLGAFSSTYSYYLIASLIGIIIISTLLFHHSSTSEKMFKALPIKSEKQFLIKILSGMSCYTLPFLLFCLVILLLRGNYIQSISDYAAFSLKGYTQQILDSIPNLLCIFLLTYLKLTFAYLFTVCFQCLVTNNIVATIFSLIIVAGPIYFIETLDAVGNHYFASSSFIPLIYSIYKNLCSLWLDGYTDLYQYPINHLANNSNYYIPCYCVQFLLLIILCVLCFWFSYQRSKRLLLEHYDRLIPFKSTRIVFSIILLLYMLTLPIFLKEILMVTDLAASPVGMLSIFLCECLIVFIAIKKYKEAHTQNEK